MDSRYVVADTDLMPLAERLLARMEAGREGSLLEMAEREPDPVEAAFYGRAYVMQHVAPRVWGEDGEREELLLFAALALFDARDAVPWRGCRDHVERSVAHLRAIGEAEGARLLRQRIDNAAHEEPPRKAVELLARSVDHHPGRLAAHDQEMAKASRRDLRAADALDPP